MENDIRVKLMGVRGTMPVHGPDCRVFGGATSCVFVSMGGQAIILDAGTGLSGPGFDSFFGAEHFTLLLTHSHVDHIMGFPPFPALFDGRRSGEVYLKTRGGLDARAQLEKLMAPPLWPIKTSAVKADVAFRDVPESFSLGDVRVDTMEIGHPGGCTAYRLSFGGRSLVYATDYEPECDAPERFLNFARGCSLLLLDAQYTPAEYANTMGFGHSTTERSLRIARGCAAKTTLLVHHDPKRTDAQLLALEAELGTAQDISYSSFSFNGEGTVAAGDGATITISRDVYISGNITFEGNFVVSGQYGKIYFSSGGSLTNNGTITLVNGGTVNGTVSGNQPVTT